MHTPHSQWDTEGQPDSKSFLTSHSSYFFYPLNGSRICRGNSLGLDVLKVLKEGRELILSTFGFVLRKGP